MVESFMICFFFLLTLSKYTKVIRYNTNDDKAPIRLMGSTFFEIKLFLNHGGYEREMPPCMPVV